MGKLRGRDCLLRKQMEIAIYMLLTPVEEGYYVLSAGGAADFDGALAMRGKRWCAAKSR